MTTDTILHPTPESVPNPATYRPDGVSRPTARTSFSCSGCDTIWYRLHWEHCTVCHKNFSSTAAGDRHRVGPDIMHERCLSADEMMEANKKDGTPVFECIVKDNQFVWRTYRRQ